MALKSDSRGFLIADSVIDVKDLKGDLKGVQRDTSAILNLLRGTVRNSVLKRAKVAASPASRTPRDVSGRSRDAAGRFIADPVAASVKKMADTVVSMSRAEAVQLAERKRADAAAARRDGSGRFAGGGRAKGDDGAPGSGTGSKKKKDGLLTRLKSRFNGDSDIAKVDPAMEASKELLGLVATPLKAIGDIGMSVIGRGFNPDAKSKSLPWYRKILTELKLLRRDETVFNKAQVRAIAGIKPGGGGDSEGPGFFGGLLGSIVPMLTSGIGRAFTMMAAPIGAAILTGLRVALPVIFGPIGLLLVTAATAAWALFTDNGQKAMREFVDRSTQLLGDAIKPLAEWFGRTFPKTTSAVGAAVSAVKEFKDRVLAPKAAPTTSAPKGAAPPANTAPVPAKSSSTPKAVVLPGMKGETAKNFEKNGPAIVGAAKKYGVNPVTSAKLARLESGNFDAGVDTQLKMFMGSNGRKGSTATGLGQFLDGTWADTVAKHGAAQPETNGLVSLATQYQKDKRGTLAKRKDAAYTPLFEAKLDANKASLMLAASTKDNMARLNAAGVANPTEAQLYSMHLGGNAKAAVAMQNDPSTPVGKVYSRDEMRRNPGIFKGTKTLGDAFGKIDSKLNDGALYGQSAAMMAGTTPATTVPAALTPPAMKMPNVSVPARVAPPPPPATSTVTPLSSRTPLAVTIADSTLANQDVRDRRLAHIATGGMTGN